MSNFEVFPPKSEVILLGTAQREDVFNQQERKKLSIINAESSKRTCAGLFFRSSGGGAKVQVTGHRPQVRSQVRSQVTHKNNRTPDKTVRD